MYITRRISLHMTLSFVSAAAIIVFALFLFTHNEADVDLWGNVGFVRQHPGQPGFHTTNTFSFTEPNHVWTNHEWLAEYILNKAYQFMGNPGLLLLKGFLGFLLLGILHHSMRRQAQSGAVRVLLLLLVISTLGYGFSTRPHLFTYILVAGLTSLLLRPSTPKALLLLAAPLGCLWANLHGAFFIGQVLLLAAILSKTVSCILKRDQIALRDGCILSTSALLFFGGTLLTPYGLHLWSFVFESASLSRPVLSEWAPLGLEHMGLHIDFIALACITTFALVASFRRSTPLGVVIFLLALIAAIAMRRNIPLFAIVAALVATRHVDATMGWRIDEIVNKLPKKMVLFLMLTIAAASCVFFVRANLDGPLSIRVPRDQFPIEAVAFLERNVVEANAFVFFDWAEYCIWKLHPRCHVFLDGRFRSAYSETTIKDYLDFLYTRTESRNALNSYPTDLVFVHVNNPCTAIMRTLEDWELAYQDQMAAIFVKRNVHNALLQKLNAKTAYIPSEPVDNRFP